MAAEPLALEDGIGRISREAAGEPVAGEHGSEATSDRGGQNQRPPRQVICESERECKPPHEAAEAGRENDARQSLESFDLCDDCGRYSRRRIHMKIFAAVQRPSLCRERDYSARSAGPVRNARLPSKRTSSTPPGNRTCAVS